MNSSIAFFIVPHYDDWQLFCGHQVFLDLQQASAKIVFIYTTADDAGRGDSWWQVGEQGAIASIQQALPFAKLHTKFVEFNNHSITRHNLKNTVNYCLRLPDGFPDGFGSPEYHFQSLKKLQAGQMAISAVDQSARYVSWQDFCDTLQAIIVFESQGIPLESCWINFTEYDGLLNPNDHADHMATASAVRSIVADKYNHRCWLTYYSYYCEPNLFGMDVKNKKQFFRAYLNATQSHPYAKKLAKKRLDEWVCWGDKSYCRSIYIDSTQIERSHYSSHYMPLENFDLKKLEQKELHFKRCVLADEQCISGNLQITNLITEKTILLNSTSAIIWEALRQPHTVNELIALIRSASPSASEGGIEIAINSLLHTLLSQKLIAVVL